MATELLEEQNILMDLHTFALFAKAAYCKVKPTSQNPEPKKNNTVDGAKDALISWLDENSGWNVYSFTDKKFGGLEVCRLGFNPTTIELRNKEVA